MAVLMAQHALDQRNAALDARQAAREQQQREQLQSAADQIRAAAAQGLVTAIIQGAFQIAGGVVPGNNGKPPLKSIPTPSQQMPSDGTIRTPQPPAVTPPVSLPSAVQARLDAIEAMRNLQNNRP